MKLILASASPRRKELLSKITTDFTVETSLVDETKIRERSPFKFALLAAELKAKEVGDRFPDAVVIGADTIVLLDGKMLGKPADLKAAKIMLRDLSGKEHKVITGLALYNGASKKMLVSFKTTSVVFKKLTKPDIDLYMKKVHVLDKAGAYAIQECGDMIIDSIKGDHDNVVGLPVATLEQMLQAFTRMQQS
jgi:septum formation protein